MQFSILTRRFIIIVHQHKCNDDIYMYCNFLVIATCAGTLFLYHMSNYFDYLNHP